MSEEHLTRSQFQSMLAVLMFGEFSQIPAVIAKLGTAATGEQITDTEAIAMAAKARAMSPNKGEAK